MYEVEQKFKLTDSDDFLAKVAELGAVWTVRVEETDTYYQHPGRDFSRTDEALRIRRQVKYGMEAQNLSENAGDAKFASPKFACFITYKGARLATETKTRPEIELPLAFSEPKMEEIGSLEELTAATRAWGDLLTALGFREVRPVRKTRQKAWFLWDVHRVEISYDEVPPTGKWAEIEVMAEDLTQLPAAEAVIRTLAGKLGLTQVEKHSYLELVMQADMEK